uniref:AB hydrolase-1 domain-containing protein n=2 Tax=Davidia involucrata TaxID=16924 RepID=A0A5B6YY41_DAVIN
MVVSCLSIVSLYGSFIHRSLSGAGLSSQTIDVDEETSIHFWGPNPKWSRSKPKPSLILIHGFGPQGMWQWRQQAIYFAPHFDVYLPDLVFFGNSTSKSSSERSEVFQAVSVGKLLEKLGVDRYSVVGTSYGGFVAYQMARMWPERVQKVVIASSAVNLRRTDNVELVKRAKAHTIDDVMLPRTAPQLRTLIGLALFNRLFLYMPDFFLNDFLHKLYSENRKEKMELLKGLTLGRDNTVNISPLQQEVLIVWGDHDQIFLLDKAIELRELLGEKARLQVIKNTSHAPQLEHAAQFNNIVNNFLCGSS